MEEVTIVENPFAGLKSHRLRELKP